MTEVKIAHDDDIIRTEEGLIFNPYNPLNVKITLCEVQSILSKYNIPPTVHNMALYERAFVHESYTKRPQYENAIQNITIVEKPQDCMPLSSKSNQRLEFLGDGVLECVTKYLLYRRFPKENEGFMTEKKIAIVGAGIFGCSIALELDKEGYQILLFEKEEDIMLKATKNNHNRIHYGYHYPRSLETTKQSLDGLISFLANYSERRRRLTPCTIII